MISAHDKAQLFELLVDHLTHSNEYCLLLDKLNIPVGLGQSQTAMAESIYDAIATCDVGRADLWWEILSGHIHRAIKVRKKLAEQGESLATCMRVRRGP